MANGIQSEFLPFVLFRDLFGNSGIGGHISRWDISASADIKLKKRLDNNSRAWYNSLMKTPKRLPTSIKILGNTYHIKYYKKRPNVAKDGDSESLYGEIRHWESEIRIFSKRSHAQIWRTIWHEVLHALIWHLRLKSCTKGKKAEETLLDNLALGLTEIELKY